MKHHRRAEPVIKDLFKERISVSLFAGCGGACVGMRAATGNEVDVAINHDKVAIAVHRQNHPTTEHRISDVFEVKPQSATRGRRVGHLHASPDCRHFSRAAGAAPKSVTVNRREQTNLADNRHAARGEVVESRIGRGRAGIEDLERLDSVEQIAVRIKSARGGA